MSRLTDHLLAAFPDAWRSATEHPFLKAAGERTLSKRVLEEWLTQDALYAGQGYTKAMGGIVTKLKPGPVNLFGRPEEAFQKKLQLHLDLVKVLGKSLVNINRELTLFIETATKHDLQWTPLRERIPGVRGQLAQMVRPNTRAYVNWMWAICLETTPEEGVFLLWAMEKCYLAAWTYAKRQSISSSPNKATQGALDTLIGNWTSSEFEAFVQELEDLVNRFEVPLDPKNDMYQKFEQIWVYTLDLERDFWPEE